MPEPTFECETCGQETRRTRVIEQPHVGEQASLAQFFWVVNPSHLIFCDAECQRGWHRLRRRSLVADHPENCLCVQCAG